MRETFALFSRLPMGILLLHLPCSGAFVTFWKQTVKSPGDGMSVLGIDSVKNTFFWYSIQWSIL